MADKSTSSVTWTYDKFSVNFNDKVRNIMPKKVFVASFLPRILKANKNRGISKQIFINQIGIPVKVFIIMDTPVNPPGAMLWGFKNIFMEIPINKQPTKSMITSSNFSDNFIFFTFHSIFYKFNQENIKICDFEEMMKGTIFTFN